MTFFNWAGMFFATHPAVFLVFVALGFGGMAITLSYASGVSPRAWFRRRKLPANVVRLRRR